MDDFRIHIRSDDADALVDRLREATASGPGLEATSAEPPSPGRETGPPPAALGRFAVSRDGDDVFVYASTAADAQRAQQLVGEGTIERWLDDQDRWSDEPAGQTWEEEELDHGFAPWEVRVDCGSRQAAGELAERLEREGYRPLRRWSYLIVGTESRDDADALAQRLHGEVEPGGELVWETLPGNPFAVFGGLGGTGTPAS